MPKCVHRTRAAGGGFLHATCSVNAQHRDETWRQLTLSATLQSPLGNNSSHPEPTRKQQQSTLYHIFPVFLRSSTKPPRPPNLGPSPQKTSNYSPPGSVLQGLQARGFHIGVRCPAHTCQPLILLEMQHHRHGWRLSYPLQSWGWAAPLGSNTTFLRTSPACHSVG